MNDPLPKVFLTDEQWAVFSARDEQGREQQKQFYLIQSGALVSTASQIVAQTEMQKNQPTMRDHFAMSALNGLLTQPDITAFSDLAEWAYQIADAMMAARGGK